MKKFSYQAPGRFPVRPRQIRLPRLPVCLIQPPSGGGKLRAAAPALSEHHLSHKRTGPQKKGHRRPAHRLSIRAAVHGRLIPDLALLLREKRLHPGRQHLIQLIFSRYASVIQAGNHLEEEPQQIVKVQSQGVQGQPDPAGVNPRFSLRRDEGRKKRPPLLRWENHGDSPETPGLQQNLILFQNVS